MVFQDLYTTKHTFADGSRADVGHVTLLGLANSVDFGVTDKFAATLSFPVGMGIYNGKNPHLLPIDNGNFHGSLQDFGIGLRYNLISRPVMFTPFVLATVGHPTDKRLRLTPAFQATRTFSWWILVAARPTGSPVNGRATWCQVGRATDGGYTLHPTALVIGKFGRCHPQVDPLCK
jgi:hypothetical protein